jgi:hypothetical protein
MKPAGNMCGRRAHQVRYKPYRKERWWGLVVIMPE